MAQHYNGTCIECGKENKVSLIDEITDLCDGCAQDLMDKGELSEEDVESVDV